LFTPRFREISDAPEEEEASFARSPGVRSTARSAGARRPRARREAWNTRARVPRHVAETDRAMVTS
jgi:hypothetical protein